LFQADAIITDADHRHTLQVDDLCAADQTLKQLLSNKEDSDVKKHMHGARFS
jgi:hypothetical protein